jgi:5''-nucleotidase/2'',3''-cyclic phosphodiesterase and related esterases
MWWNPSLIFPFNFTHASSFALHLGILYTFATNIGAIENGLNTNGTLQYIGSLPSLPLIDAVQDSPLFLQDINFLVVTDVHSWVAGHPHNESLNADYGDVFSFYERLKNRSMEEEKDLFFVMNGDFMDGTGLSTYPPEYLTPILQQMPWDALNIGNHELYKNETIEYITQPGGFVDFWDGRYLTSNVLLSQSNAPIGERYTFLHGTYSGYTILTFGFLYDFLNNCQITTIETVESVVNSTWFQNVLEGNEENFDAILVLAHMDAFDPLVTVLLDKIRSICGPNMPVQFITGHSHARKFQQLDPFSTSFEAGRYLDTIGFASLSFNATSASFDHIFIDADIAVMKDMLDMPESESIETKLGRDLTELIVSTQDKLGLNQVIGCSPMTYYVTNSLNEPDSLWGLYVNTIVPRQLFKGSDSKILIQNTGAFRYDLFEGNTTLNDIVTVSPYNDTLYMISEEVNGSDFLRAFGEPNAIDDNAYVATLPQLVVSGSIVKDKVYKVYTVEFDVGFVSSRLSLATGRVLNPLKVDGQTTGTLWLNFIKDHWTCSEEVEKQDAPEGNSWKKFTDFIGSFTPVKMIAFIMTFIVIVFFGWMFLCRQTRQRVSADDYEVESYDHSYDDDSGILSQSEDENSSVFPISTNGTPKANRLYHSIPDENGIV